jgi:hypothetical protein
MAVTTFIGAGVMLRNTVTGTVDGLTTAATVWMAAALGSAHSGMDNRSDRHDHYALAAFCPRMAGAHSGTAETHPEDG